MSDPWLSPAGPPLRGELDRLWLNQQAAAHNLANMNTPGFTGTRYERTGNDFAEKLGAALDRTNARHLDRVDTALPSGVTARPVVELSPDDEMAEVARTQVRYQTLLEIVARRDRLLRTALEGR